MISLLIRRSIQVAGLTLLQFALISCVQVEPGLPAAAEASLLQTSCPADYAERMAIQELPVFYQSDRLAPTRPQNYLLGFSSDRKEVSLIDIKEGCIAYAVSLDSPIQQFDPLTVYTAPGAPRLGTGYRFSDNFDATLSGQAHACELNGIQTWLSQSGESLRFSPSWVERAIAEHRSFDLTACNVMIFGDAAIIGLANVSGSLVWQTLLGDVIRVEN